jgi:hypothetical protein
MKTINVDLDKYDQHNDFIIEYQKLKLLNSLIGQDNFSLYLDSDIDKQYKTLGIEALTEEKFKHEFKSDKVRFKGFNIRLSEIKEFLLKNTEKISSIEILAVNEVVFDRSLNCLNINGLNGPSISIIAPVWRMSQQLIEINISGRDGTAATDREKYASLEHALVKQQGKKGVDGEDGISGKSGSNGGNFVGLFNQIIGDRKNLKIISVGGKGGKGGNGQDGQDGQQGGGCDDEMDRYSFLTINDKNQYHASHGTIPIEGKFGISGYELSGKGGDGGNGGKGAAGGKGGAAGEIYIIPNDNNIAIHKFKGEPGESGKSGKPGKGADGGVLLVSDQEHKFIHWHVQPRTLQKAFQLKKVKSIYIAGRGGTEWFNAHSVPSISNKFEGRDGQCQEAVVPNNDPEPKALQATFDSIIEHKKYLVEYSKAIRSTTDEKQLVNEQQLVKKVALNVLLSIKNIPSLKGENNIQVNDIIYRLEALQKITGLDKLYQIQQQNDIDEIIQVFNLYKDNIRDFFVKHKICDVQTANVLKYLFTAAHSIICKVNDSTQTVLITNLPKYMKLVRENINSFKDVSLEIEKNEIRDNFNNNIELRIKEATALLSNIQENIKSEEDEIFKSITGIQREIEEMKVTLKDNSRQLIEARDKLADAQNYKLILGIINVACQVASFAGPVGMVAGSIGSSLTSIASNFIDEPQIPNKISADWLSASKQVREQANNKIIGLELEALKDAKEAIEAEKDELGKAVLEYAEMRELDPELKKYDKQFKDRIKTKEKEYKSRISTVEAERQKKLATTPEGRKELLDLYKKGLNEMDSNAPGRDITIKKIKALSTEVSADSATKALDNVDKGTKTVNQVITVVQEQRVLRSKIGEIDKKIKENEETINNLGKTAEAVKDVHSNLVKHVYTQLENFEENLKGKSTIALSYSKFSIVKYLNDIKANIDEATSGFKNNKKITGIIDKMQDAIKSMIAIHEHIQNHREKAELASYIASFNMSDNSIPKKYIDAINSVKAVLDGNQVMGKYYKVLQAFKQLYFPYSNMYLQEVKHNLTENVEDVIKVLEHVTSKLIEDDSTLTPRIDNYLLEFNASAARPFFTWDYEGNRSEIKKLLLGEKAKLRSTVEDSSLSDEFYAVKFTKVSIKIMLDKNNVFNPINDKLQAILKNYCVLVTHSGHSDYKIINDKNQVDVAHIYSNGLSENKVSLEHNYGYVDDNIRGYYCVNVTQLKAEGKPISKPILSPFTIWDIQLKPNPTVVTHQESLLQQISQLSAGIIDPEGFAIHLTGEGMCVKQQIFDEVNFDTL